MTEQHTTNTITEENPVDPTTDTRPTTAALNAQLPESYDTDTLIHWLARQKPMPTVNQVEKVLLRVGHVNGPYVLYMLRYVDKLSPESATATVGPVWSMAEYPDKCLSHRRWRDLFTLAGYTVEGVPAERPTETLTLYRGSVPERRADWSWTDNRAVAERYAAGGLRGRRAGTVWIAQVEPWRLLARNTGRSEDEYVVDTAKLTITPADSTGEAA